MASVTPSAQPMAQAVAVPIAQAQPMQIQQPAQRQQRVPRGQENNFGDIMARIKKAPLGVKICIGFTILIFVAFGGFMLVQDVRGCNYPRQFCQGGAGQGDHNCFGCEYHNSFACRSTCGGVEFCGQTPCGAQDAANDAATAHGGASSVQCAGQSQHCDCTSDCGQAMCSCTEAADAADCCNGATSGR